MKFQNISIHGSKLMLYPINGQKLQRAITPTTFHLIDSKPNQVISSSVPVSILNIKVLAQILFEISC